MAASSRKASSSAARHTRRLLFLTMQADYPTLQTLDGIHQGLDIARWLIRTALIGSSNAELLKRMQPDAVILEPHGKVGPIAQLLVAQKIPFISLGRRIAREPLVTLDEYGAGRKMAAYLIEKGFRQLACLSESRYVQARVDGFCEEARNHGIEVHLNSDIKPSPWMGTDDKDWEWKEAVSWLKSLPKPVGLAVVHPMHGYGVTEICERCGIRVPEEIAIIASMENPTVCRMAPVPITGLRIGYHALGLKTAQLLSAWMERGVKPPEQSVVELGAVVERESTDIVAAGDPMVSKVAAWISNQMQQAITVKDLLKVAGVSRPVLERRFKAALGRSPLQEIHRQKFRHACELLLAGNTSIGEVGQQCGMSDPFRFSAFFRKMSGCAPKTFREQKRSQST